MGLVQRRRPTPSSAKEIALGCVCVQNHPHQRSTAGGGTWQTEHVRTPQRGLGEQWGREVRQEKGKLMTSDFTGDRTAAIKSEAREDHPGGSGSFQSFQAS